MAPNVPGRAAYGGRGGNRWAGGYPIGAYQGDPGIFGAIGGALKGAVTGLLSGGPIGALTGALSGGIQGATGKTVKQAVAGAALPGLTTSSPKLAALTGMPLVATGPGFTPPAQQGVGLALPGGGMIGFGGGIPTAGITAGSVGGVGYYAPQGTAVGPVMKRGHLNKTGYFLKNGTYVPPGSKVVANRRMNPLNPTSLSKSLRRMQSFARATKHMRSEAGKVASAVAGPKRHSCGGGCKTRKR